MSKKEKQNQLSFGNAILSVFIYAVVGIVICFGVAFIFSILIYFEKIPETMILPFSCISVLVGAFFACRLSVKKFGRPLMTSFVQGSIFLLVLYIAGSIVFKRFIPSGNVVFVFISCISSALFNAVFSALFNKHRKN